MLIEHIVLALVLILGLSLLARPLSHFLRMPFASILVVLGFVASEIIVYLGVDTGIRADNFQSIIFYVFIPILVFEAAYNIDKAQLKNNLIVILFLAIIAMLLTCLIAAVLLFYGIGHETGFPWMAALITGSILAATDPVAVVTKLREMNAPKRITVLLEGESLFNDATAIVLFTLFLSIVTASSAPTVLPASSSLFDASLDVLWKFSIIFFGGAFIGVLFGSILGLLNKLANEALLTGVMSLVVAYGSYLIAEHFMVSGVMSTLLAALSFTMINDSVEQLGHADESTGVLAEVKNNHLWDVLAYVANVSVFLFMGAVITLEMFEQRWLAIVIAIVALLVARMISVYGVLALFAFFKNLKVPLHSQTVMVWGGLRGAVTLALALSIPTSLEYWWTIQSIAFGVVMFSLFIQAPTMKWMIEWLAAKEG